MKNLRATGGGGSFSPSHNRDNDGHQNLKLKGGGGGHRGCSGKGCNGGGGQKKGCGSSGRGTSPQQQPGAQDNFLSLLRHGSILTQGGVGGSCSSLGPAHHSPIHLN